MDEPLFSGWSRILIPATTSFRLKMTNCRNPRANWANISRIGWIATTVLLAFLLWQVAANQPLWPPVVSALLLIVIGVLAGLRVGADSLAAYTNDVHRRNKLLADQNRELQDANATLLKQVTSRNRQLRGLRPSRLA